jgi:hypothetical protein
LRQGDLLKPPLFDDCSKGPASQLALLFAVLPCAPVHPAFTKQSQRNRQLSGTSRNSLRCLGGQCRHVTCEETLND